MGKGNAQIFGTGVGLAAGIITGIFTGGAGFAFANALMAFGIGSTVGTIIGGSLFPTTAEETGNPLGNPSAGLEVSTSSYGQIIKVLFGTKRIGGNLIWHGNFQSHVITVETEIEGGKGGGGSATASSSYYTYSVSLAYGICMGNCDVLKVYAGENLVPVSSYTVYDGTQVTADPHIASFTTRDPVYKGLCYVVLPNYNLGRSPYIPNFTFEVAWQPGVKNYIDETETNIDKIHSLDMENGNALIIYSTSGLAEDLLRVAFAKIGSGVNYKDYLTLLSWTTPAWVSYGSEKLSDSVALIYRTTSGYADSKIDIVKITLSTSSLSILTSDNAVTTGVYSTFTAIENDDSGNARVLEIWPIAEGASNCYWKGRIHTINLETGVVTTGTTYTDANAIPYPGTHQVTAYATSNKVLLAYCDDLAGAGTGPIYFMILSVNSSNVVSFGTSANTGSSFSGTVQPIRDAWLNSTCTEMLVPVVEDSDKTSYIYLTISGTSITIGTITRYPDYTDGTSYHPGNCNLIMSSSTSGKLLCGGKSADFIIAMKDVSLGVATSTDSGGVPYGSWFTGLYMSEGTIRVYGSGSLTGSYILIGSTIYTITQVWTGITDDPNNFAITVSPADNISYEFSFQQCTGPSTIYTYNSVEISLDADIKEIGDGKFNSLLENNNSVIKYNSTYFIFYASLSGSNYLCARTLVDNTSSGASPIDYPPPVIAKEILTNDFYGLGLSDSYLDENSFLNTGDFCIDNDFLVTILYDKHQSILDALQYLIQHHDGFISYDNGKIYYNQLKYNPEVDVIDYEENINFSDDFSGLVIDTDKWTTFLGTDEDPTYKVLVFQVNKYEGYTLDGGANWTDSAVLMDDPVQCAIAIDNIVIVGIGQKIYRSVDAGETFTDLGAQTTDGSFHCLTHNGEGIVLASSGITKGEIARSTDSGETWTNLGRIDTGIEDIKTVLFIGSSIAVAFCGDVYSGKKLYRSTDSGATWSLVSDPVTPNLNYANDGIDLGSGIAVVGMSYNTWNYPKVIRTTDYGLTWSEINSPAGARNTDKITRNICDCGDGILLCSTYIGQLWRSTDYGLNWTVILDSLSYLSYFGVGGIIHQGNGKVVWSFNDSYWREWRARSSDYGLTWTRNVYGQEYKLSADYRVSAMIKACPPREKTVTQNGEILINISGYSIEEDIGITSKSTGNAFYAYFDFNSFSVNDVTDKYGYAGLRIIYDEDNYIEVGRKKKSGGTNKYYAKKVYEGVADPETTLDSSDTDGSLKIARAGGTVSCYYKLTGTWTLIVAFEEYYCAENYIEIFGRAEEGITLACNYDSFKYYGGVNSLYSESILDEEYPINIVKKGANTYYNKIIAEYVNREKGYSVGTVIADDTVDIDEHGLKEQSIDLRGFSTDERCSKMANHILKKTLINPETITFKLGINNFQIRPGDLKFLTDFNCELYDEPVRIMNVSENSNYEIEIEAFRESDMYGIWNYGSIPNEEPQAPDFVSPSLPIESFLAVEIPARYSLYSCRLAIACTPQSIDSYFAGFSLYKSYITSGTFTRMNTSTTIGILGVVSAVNDTTITIVLETDDTLESMETFNELMMIPNKNLVFVRTSVGDKFFRFQIADLIDTNTWKLSGLLFDLVNIPLVNVTTDVAIDDEIMIFDELTFNESLIVGDRNRTLYLKVPTFNQAGSEILLSDCTEETVSIIDMSNTPIRPFFIDVNSVGIRSDKEVTVGSGDIILTWMSRNRFNDGANNYTNSDAIPDDIEFASFRIYIYNGSTLLRTVNATDKTYTYTSALQASDGGSTPYIFKLYQINSNKVGIEYDQITVNLA